MKPDKFHRRCCYNCTHHLAYHMNGQYKETVVCSLRAAKTCTTSSGMTYVGVDYSQRIPADSPPCDKWKEDTNVPSGFKWEFERTKQLTLKL